MLQAVIEEDSQIDLLAMIWSVVYFVYGNQISCGEKFKSLDRASDLNFVMFISGGLRWQQF